jgi:hypothetical protein
LQDFTTFQETKTLLRFPAEAVLLSRAGHPISVRCMYGMFHTEITNTRSYAVYM